MTATVGALRVMLGMDSAELDRGAKKAQATMQNFAASLVSISAKIGAVVGAALSPAILTAGLKSAAEEIDKIGKMSESLGIPVEQLSKMKYAADLSGSSLEGLANSVKRLSVSMAGVAKGADNDAARAFKALGVEVTNADGTLRSTDAVMEDLAESFSQVRGGADKTAAAMAIFGRSGADLIPYLNSGRDGLREMAAEAEHFGLVIGDDTVKHSTRFNDNIGKMGLVTRGMTNIMTAEAIPAFDELTTRIIDGAKETQAFRNIGVFLGRVLVGIAAAGNVLVSVIQIIARNADTVGVALLTAFGPAVVAMIGKAAVAIGATLVGAFRLLAATMLANPMFAFVTALTVAVTAAYHFRDEIKEAIGVDVVEIVRYAVNLIIGSFVAGFIRIRYVLRNFPSVVASAMINVVNAFIRGINSMVSIATDGINLLIASLNTVSPVKIPLLPPDAGQIKEFVNEYGQALKSETEQMNAEVAAAYEREYLGRLANLFSSSTQETKKFGNSLRDLNLAGNEAAGGINKAGKAAKEAGEAADYSRSIWDDLKSTLSGSFNRIFDGFVNGTMKARDALRQLASDLAKMVANKAFKTLLDGLFGNNPGGGLGGILGSLIGGARAKGGPVSSGRAYLVGERGPELMVPNMNGSVIPNEALAGGSVHVSVGVSVDNDGNLQAFVKNVARQEGTRVVGAFAQSRAFDARVQQAYSDGRTRGMIRA
jgi:hypothetical protein